MEDAVLKISRNRIKLVIDRTHSDLSTIPRDKYSCR